MNIITKRGSILTITLWLIATMAVFGLGLARMSRATYGFSKRMRDDFLSLNAVKAVVESAIEDRKNDLTPLYDTVSELENDKDYIAGDLRVEYVLVDEGVKININKVTSTVLKNLPSMDMDKAVAITSSKYKPFPLKEKILMLDEIDEEDYEEIKDFITVYGGGGVNINTCDEEILGYLGLDDTLVGRIMEFRSGEDGELYTEDDGVFESAESIVEAIMETIFLTASEKTELQVFAGKRLVSVKSDYYQINATVYFNDKVIKRYFIMIGKGAGGEYGILGWKEQ